MSWSVSARSLVRSSSRSASFLVVDSCKWEAFSMSCLASSSAAASTFSLAEVSSSLDASFASLSPSICSCDMSLALRDSSSWVNRDTDSSLCETSAAVRWASVLIPAISCSWDFFSMSSSFLSESTAARSFSNSTLPRANMCSFSWSTFSLDEASAMSSATSASFCWMVARRSSMDRLSASSLVVRSANLTLSPSSFFASF